MRQSRIHKIPNTVLGNNYEAMTAGEVGQLADRAGERGTESQGQAD